VIAHITALIPCGNGRDKIRSRAEALPAIRANPLVAHAGLRAAK
jgi:hypothetical protein